MKFPGSFYRNNKHFVSIILYSFILFFCTSCLNYYKSIYTFNSNFEQGNFKEAANALDKDKKAETRKTRLIYYMNRGVVESMQGNYEASNAFFEKAYLLGEDLQVNYFNEAASFLLNPNIVDYKGEDFELLLINYYKALNYLKMGDKEKALVECKRMDIKLSKLSSKYTSDNKFQRDAFIHTLMGIIYDANGDANNAFVAYRNALEIYQTDYQKFFQMPVPQQLKEDLLRVAYENNFLEDLHRYEKEFNMKFTPDKGKKGDLVFLWHNGLGPVKAETSINFTLMRGQAGVVNFSNEELNLNFAFPVDDSTYYKSGLSQLELIRIVFPKYIERPTLYSHAELSWNEEVANLDMVENVNAVAFKTLNQRMVWEVSKSLLRVAMKKASEYTLRKENQEAGALLGIVNAITEQADTRNWQSVPHSIYYTRMRLPEGTQEVKFTTKAIASGKPDQNFTFTFDIKPGETIFHTFSSLETASGFATALR
ncbi:hypothetical protein Q0590_20595 [Rhodocytophaga aerolata]|uniref:Tetratricopeptide repeat protein n=1 Tax=Rhodocytophaga aerolata TaxID=455078 RepID=A0ABT8RBU8_9BACT|nr:hypothetical protein [Rhodocytophaga aerolata]MDO1448688.1 hypothetical protein [Rhodocytophaga aerolata]